MARKKDVSAIISGAGLIAGIFTDLVAAVKARGGTDKDIHRLSTPEGRGIIDKLAEIIVSTRDDLKKAEVSEASLSDWLGRWETFYREIFGVELDSSQLKIPEPRVGFARLIVVAQGMTADRIFAKCEELFPSFHCPCHPVSTVESVRYAKGDAYAVWGRDRVEADEEHKSKSANRLKEEGVNGVTLEERILMELFYFQETKGHHLDRANLTICSGSRFASGSVPRVYWVDGRFRVSDSSSAYCDHSARAREVVSV